MPDAFEDRLLLPWRAAGLFSKAKELSARRANTRRAHPASPAVKLLSDVAQ
jgi:hypothetical protein